MSEELPNEMRALVLRKQVQDVHDIVRIQRLSNTFQTLVDNNCWTNVKSIALGIEQHEDGEERVLVEIETGLPGQNLHLPISQAAAVLEKLVQKATKTSEVSVNFRFMVEERHDQVLRRFFDALLAAQIKINKFHMNDFNSENHLTTALPALARFLGANTQSLTGLSLFSCFEPGEAVPEDLIQVFQACRSLEKAKMCSSAPLVESVLQGQTQLQYLVLCVNTPSDEARSSAVALLESGARLLELYCYIGTMEAYLAEVRQPHRSLDHPLLSLTKLELDYVPSSVPWALFPNLELINFWDCGRVEDARQLAESFLAHWPAAGVKKALECRLEGMCLCSKDDLQKVADTVQTASGCQATITRNDPDANPAILKMFQENGLSTDQFADRTIFFQKEHVTFKFLLPAMSKGFIHRPNFAI